MRRDPTTRFSKAPHNRASRTIYWFTSIVVREVLFMSKVVMSLPQGIIKNSLIGGMVALAAYLLLQMACALLIHRELIGMEAMYPMVCVSAAVAAFLGCGYSVLRRREAAVLTASAVVAVFLTVTLAAAFVTADAIAVENGLTGVGLSMAAGGLAAALVGSNLPGSKRGVGKGRGRRRRWH